MIDPLKETIVSLTEAAKGCPTRRGGKRTSVSCFYRWTTSGCKGIVLESLQVGGTRCTSLEALSRFFQRLTAQRDQKKAPGKLSEPALQSAETVEQELNSHGIR